MIQGRAAAKIAALAIASNALPWLIVALALEISALRLSTQQPSHLLKLATSREQ